MTGALPAIDRTGSTRTVILFFGWAVKLPGSWMRGYRWKSLLQGLLANMQERAFARTGWPELCPVAFSLPGGLLLIMRRAAPLSRDEWFAFDFSGFVERDDYFVPVEEKMSSFGKFGGRIVAIDYGD